MLNVFYRFQFFQQKFIKQIKIINNLLFVKNWLANLNLFNLSILNFSSLLKIMNVYIYW